MFLSDLFPALNEVWSTFTEDIERLTLLDFDENIGIPDEIIDWWEDLAALVEIFCEREGAGEGVGGYAWEASPCTRGPRRAAKGPSYGMGGFRLTVYLLVLLSTALGYVHECVRAPESCALDAFAGALDSCRKASGKSSRIQLVVNGSHVHFLNSSFP